MTHTGGIATAHGIDQSGEYVDVTFNDPAFTIRFYKSEHPERWPLMLESFEGPRDCEAKYEGDPAALTDFAVKPKAP